MSTSVRDSKGRGFKKGNVKRSTGTGNEKKDARIQSRPKRIDLRKPLELRPSEIDFIQDKIPRRFSTKDIARPKLRIPEKFRSRDLMKTDPRKIGSVTRFSEIQRKEPDYDLGPSAYVPADARGTLFFVTVNSNRSPMTGHWPLLTFANTDRAIHELDLTIKAGHMIFNDEIHDNASDHIYNVDLMGAAEVGTIMERLHVHMVVRVDHDIHGAGHYRLNIPLLMDHFNHHWGIEDCYVNVKAVEYDPKTHRTMVEYIDAYKRDVTFDPEYVAPRAFFNF